MATSARRSFQLVRRLRLGLLAALPLLLCSGCVSGEHLAQAQAPTPVFDPAAFFTGATQGRAVLKIAFHQPQSVTVAGQGHLERDGTLILDQSVRTGAAAPTQRRWHLHRDTPQRWSGTLSDASGPVDAEIDGNLLHLGFAMKGGLQAQQWLYLQPGGAKVRNVMVIRKFGLAVARLDETITKAAGTRDAR